MAAWWQEKIERGKVRGTEFRRLRIRKRFDQAASRRLERGLLRGLHSAIELISPPGR